MKVNWIYHKNKRILYSDYRGMDTDTMITQLKHEADIILKEPSDVLYMANFENTVIAPQFMKVANELGKTTEKKVTKSSIIGITGLKGVLLNSYNLFTGSKMRAFKDENAAKDYLVN
jgi:hypothetical protein